MKVKRVIHVPTGHIFVAESSSGMLTEFLSLGDYGKDVNLKCDALGLTRDISQVHHTTLLPLEKKWVITISTQYGCSMNCLFCDCPKVGPGKNISLADLIGQVEVAKSIHNNVKFSEHLNIHYARMGEPTWNPDVLLSAKYFKGAYPQYNCHPVVSTMMPRHNNRLNEFLTEWMRIKNTVYSGDAGLQLSINSTDENERKIMFSNNARTLEEISKITKEFIPVGRKITLNFAVANYTINPDILLRYFNPDYFIIKLTPMHKTAAALQHDIETCGDYTTFTPYKHIEEKLKKAGYDVLVFITSEEEDKGRITCGNAIISGTTIDKKYINGDVSYGD